MRRSKREEKRKLSYKQKFALETLPGKMDALSKEIVVLEDKLADPQLYAKDPALLPRLPIFLRRSAPKMRPWKKNGWSWKCCERKSKGRAIPFDASKFNRSPCSARRFHRR